MKVDLIYLWVDGCASEFMERKAKYLKGIDQSDKETFSIGRFKDNDELRYSLRSVDMYAPWINHIYIVTDNQYPKWLNIHNPKVTIIDHSSLFDHDILPLYNSRAIEQGLHRIEGLNECFLYANDDMMFARAVTPEFFFEKTGVAKCRFTKSKVLKKDEARMTTHCYTLKKACDTINRDFGLNTSRLIPHHNIDAYTKSAMHGCLERYKQWSNLTIANRFRSRDDIQRHIISLYSVATNQGMSVIHTRPTFYGIYGLSSIISTMFGSKGVDSLFMPMNKKGIKIRIKLFKPALLCFNDTEYVSDDDRLKIKLLLEELYPVKSQFEK